jgi:hypothetical protein
LAITRAKTSSIAQGPSTKRTLLADNPVILGGSYESIATYTVGTAQATISFTSIPSTYSHLQLRIFSKNTSDSYSIRAQYNGDTASNYSLHGLYGTGSVAGSFGYANQTNGEIGMSADTTANVFAASVVDILDYANTNKNTTIRTLQGYEANGSGHVRLNSGLWTKTPREAVNAIRIYPDGGASFIVNSHFALYGIRG